METKERDRAYILVIDDDPLLTKTMKKILEKAGFFVDVANDGKTGIEKAKSGFFHLILCDIKMPGLDGLMTIRHIKKFQDEAGAGKSGVIIITAYDTDAHHQQAAQLGVTDFMKKPFDVKKFIEVINHHAETLLRQNPQEDVEKWNKRLDMLLKELKKKDAGNET